MVVRVMKRLVIGICLSVILSAIVVIPFFTAYAQSVTTKTPLAQGPLQQINEYFSTQTTTYSDGTILNRSIIKGPPRPPPGHALERAPVALPDSRLVMATNTLTDVPAFNWVFGCSAVSGAMIAGYYDRNGFPNMYTGPTDDGLMPLAEDPSWGSWTDSVYETYPNNPLIASHNGLDGRSTKGSIDDYWVEYNSWYDDPYITGGWARHTWGDAIGDYMKTSQSAYGNTDGATSFHTFRDIATPLSCNKMEDYDVASIDGTYGRKLFYEARGYMVSECYAQQTDNQIGGGFSFAQYKEEIDAGRPVLLNLEGHSIVGVGYDDSYNTVYIHDTWDNSDHTMTWGGSYSDMPLLGVSIVNLWEPPQPSLLEGSIGTELVVSGSGFGTKKGKVLIGGIPAKIGKDGWSPSRITCAITKPPLPAEVAYPVTVVVNRVSIPLEDTFTVKNPVLDNLLISSGRYPDPITITGMFFGTKKGKVYLEDPISGKKKNLKVTFWEMIASTGASTLTFEAPKPSKSFPSGSSYPLKVANKVGTVTASIDFTLEP